MWHCVRRIGALHSVEFIGLRKPNRKRKTHDCKKRFSHRSESKNERVLWMQHTTNINRGKRMTTKANISQFCVIAFDGVIILFFFFLKIHIKPLSVVQNTSENARIKRIKMSPSIFICAEMRRSLFILCTGARPASLSSARAAFNEIDHSYSIMTIYIKKKKKCSRFSIAKHVWRYLLQFVDNSKDFHLLVCVSFLFPITTGTLLRVDAFRRSDIRFLIYLVGISKSTS